MKNKNLHRVFAMLLSISLVLSQMTITGAMPKDSVSGNSVEESVSENDMAPEDILVSQTTGEDEGTPGDADEDPQNPGNPTNPEDKNDDKSPAKVAEVKLQRITYQSHKITFQALENVVGYEIYRATKEDLSDRVLLTGEQTIEGTQVTYTDTSAIEVGTTYYYQVRAYVMNMIVNIETGEKQAVRRYGEYSDAVSILAYLDQVTNVQAKPATYQSNEITWNAVGGADGYQVYYALAPAGPFVVAQKVSGSLAASFTHEKTADGAGLLTGTTYFYKVCAYKTTLSGDVLSEDSLVCSATPVLPSVQNLKTTSKSYKSLQLDFSLVEGASGYEVYRSTKPDKGFKKVATLKAQDKVTYLDKKCNTGIKYYYKVRAYKSQSAATVYSEYSENVIGIALLAKPKILSTSLVTGDTVEVKWKKVTGAQGYIVYRSDAKKGTYKKVATLTQNVDGVQIGGQENGKTFYYKVKAYRKVSGKKRLSDYSSAKYAVFNWFASAYETYTEKARRIFGTDYYSKYSSSAEAAAHMTTFAIQVWDLTPDRTAKVSKTRMITTNTNIAPTVKQIFKEIYESEERFPIKSIGCYSWRGDTSTSEHCCGLAIDINWEENYMIDNGVILSGKYWKPGIDPYSIPLDCELVRIMKKYGFSRGMWGNRIDYMHFSYFGT